MSKQGNCESCLNYVYDEEYECYTCLVDLDEDEMENFMRENTAGCPFFRFDNEYNTVNKQIYKTRWRRFLYATFCSE